MRTVGELIARSSAEHASSVQVQVFLTGEAEAFADMGEGPAGRSSSRGSTSSDNKIASPEKGISLPVPGRGYEGRPQLPGIVQEEASRAAEAGGSLSVYVCGPITMQDDVRNAVAEENLNIIKGQRSGSVYLHSEHFSWA